jgi:CHAT domain-containing protein
VLIDYFTYWRFEPKSETWSKHIGATAVPPERNENVTLHDLGSLDALISVLDKVSPAVKSMENSDGDGFREWNKASSTALDGRTGILDDLKHKLSDTYDTTLSFCDEQLARRQRIYICPDDELWFVPWACLPRQGVFLVESHLLTLLTSARTLSRDTVAGITTNTAVIFADPNFSLPIANEPAQPSASNATRVAAQTPAGGVGEEVARPQNANRTAVAAKPANQPAPMSKPRWSLPVPFDRVEMTNCVVAIENKLKQIPALEVSLFAADSATETAFKAVRNPRYLVLVTHGVYESLNAFNVKGQTEPPWSIWHAHEFDSNAAPLARCGLALAGVNSSEYAFADGEDGYLSGIEIASSDLRGTELVFFSACEMGLENERCGDAVASLYRSFEIAGTRNVIGKLWHVDDAASAEFSNEYWQQLADGSDHATALRNTQLAFLKHDRYSHPYYWAPFRLVQRY